MKLSPYSLETAKSRYLLDTEQAWDELAVRVGGFLGDERFSQVISDLLFIPGGRICRNAGRGRGSLYNCYHPKIGDSMREILQAQFDCGILWKHGGGTGLTLSSLRPKGAPLVSSGGISSGPMSFAHAFNAWAGTIETGGQRRAAGLLLMDVWHPDIFDFMRCKQNDGDMDMFNLSVGVNEDFIDAVQDNDTWNLEWRGTCYGTFDAVDIWNEIIVRMCDNGEPGLINMDNLCSNNSWYYAPITGTNPCGETCLSDDESCNLGSIVLPNFVSPNGRVQWKKLEEVIHIGIRLLDTVIDYNPYILQSVKQASQKGRRVGLGVMGLGDMLFLLKLRYGSRDAIDFIERLFKFIRNACYEASIKLAVEKGTFPAYDTKNYLKSHFVRTLPPSLRGDIRKFGMRNVTTMAMAPTGTISLIPEVTSGIEPLFARAYIRKDRISEKEYIHPMVVRYMDDSGAIPDWLVDCSDLRPEDHINTQIAIQRYCDGAVSKTINLPADFKPEDLSDLLLESIKDLKGCTVYRDGSRDGQVLNTLTPEETVACARGTCEV